MHGSFSNQGFLQQPHDSSCNQDFEVMCFSSHLSPGSRKFSISAFRKKGFKMSRNFCVNKTFSPHVFFYILGRPGFFSYKFYTKTFLRFRSSLNFAISVCNVFPFLKAIRVCLATMTFTIKKPLLAVMEFLITIYFW